MKQVIYRCDRCNKEIHLLHTLHIEVQVKSWNHRKASSVSDYHFCEDCKSLFYKFLEMTT